MGVDEMKKCVVGLTAIGLVTLALFRASGVRAAGDISANTLTANEIAANAITTSELNADSVTSAKIAAGTIEASDIAAGTITADRMNVSTLSAITANLGSVTAGSISGVTATFGSGGEVSLNSGGISLNGGVGDNNKIKWSDGTRVFGAGDGDLWLTTSGGVLQLVGSSGVNLTGGLTVASNLHVASGELRVAPFSGAGTARFVCHDNDGDFYSSGGTCDGSAPAAEAQDARIAALEREIADLRALLQQLQARQ
jgi:hypothetical protein